MPNTDTVTVTYDAAESVAIAISLIPFMGEEYTDSISQKFIEAHDAGEPEMTVDLTAEECGFLGAALMPNRDIPLVKRIARKTVDAIEAQKLTSVGV